MSVFVNWVGWDATQWQLAIAIEFRIWSSINMNRCTIFKDTLDNNMGIQTLLLTRWVRSHWFRVSEGATLDRGFALSSIQPSVLRLPNSADWRGWDRKFPHLSLVKWGIRGKTEGERELSVWMGAWFGLLEGWSTRVLKKSGKRRKTRENNVAKKREYNTVY